MFGGQILEYCTGAVFFERHSKVNLELISQ